jgi:AcrR family transcriptional regulator
MAQPRRTPLQARATRTRAALVEAAVSEFSEKGYAGTTARSIAARAGTATGSFYQYFNDKDELLRELYAARIAHVRAQAEVLFTIDPGASEQLGQSVRDAFGTVVQVVLDLHRENPELHAVITEREHADPLMHAHAQNATSSLVQGVALLLTHLGYKGDTLARAFVIFGLVEGSVHAHVLGGPIVSDRRFKRDLVLAVEALVGHGVRDGEDTSEPSPDQ